MKEVREVPKEQWDDLVEKSEQGTIFCRTKWLDLYGLYYKLYGYFSGDALLGGTCGFWERRSFYSGDVALTPFQGILVSPVNSAKYTTIMSRHNEVAVALRDFLDNEYQYIVLRNHYSFPDIRPFLWAHWQPKIRFTYVLNTTDRKTMWDNLEKQTRYEINQGGMMSQWALGYFDDLYAKTFERKGLERPISKEFLQKLHDSFECRIVGTANSMAYVIWDNKRAYYILGASDGTGSAGAVWAMLDGVSCMGIKEIDFVGANDEKISLFKRGFGGELRAYYSVSL